MRCDSSSLTLLDRGTRWLALVLLCLLATACSTIKMGYNNADTVLLYSLDRYVDLTSEQEQVVRERVAQIMVWHRSTQLPDYAAFVQSARQRLDAPVLPADVIEFNQGLNARLAALGEQVAPHFAALALTFSPPQIDQLERKLVDDNAKERRESAAELRQALEKRAEKYSERAEFWLGKLTPLQRQLVRDSLAGRPVDSLYWLEARERRSRALIAMLRRIESERPSQDVATRWIHTYFGELARPSDPTQRTRAETFRRDNAQLVAQLLNSATPEQRAHLDRRLSGFATEFVQLAQRNGGSS